MNELRSERLRADLAALADASVAVDLRDAVLLGSRRVTVRRRVTMAVTVAVVVAATIGALAAVLPGRRVLPTHPTPAITTSPVTASPTPSALDYADPTLSAWSEEAGPSFPGTTYLDSLSQGSQPGLYRLDISILAGGTLRTATLGDLALGDCVFWSYTLSPDGRHLAWALGDADGTGGQVLVVQPIDGGAARRYPMNISCSGGDAPRWLADGRSILVSDHDRGLGTVDIVTGVFTPYTGHVSPYGGWSRDGAFHAYADGGDIVVEDSTGREVRRHAYQGFGCCGRFAVQSVSDDGRRVGVSSSRTDNRTVRGVEAVVDMATGQNVQLPLPRFQAAGTIVFVSGGRLLILAQGRGANLQLYRADGTLVAQVRLRPPLQGGDVMLYQP